MAKNIYLFLDGYHWACSEIRSRVLRSATVPFFYDKNNGTVALRSSKHFEALWSVFQNTPINTDVTPAILSLDIVAQLYHATKMQHATVRSA